MPEYLAPGVYVEEVSFRAKSIEGVSTSTAAFVGPTRRGPVGETPELLTSFADFERIYGGLGDLTIGGVTMTNYVAHAVRAFFNEGGARLYVSRVAPGNGAVAASSGNIRSGAANANEQISFVGRASGTGGNGSVNVFQKEMTVAGDALTRAPRGSLLRVPPAGAGGNPTFFVKGDTDWRNPDNTAAAAQPTSGELLTLTVVTRDADGSEMIFDDLGFHPTHTRYAGNILTQTPTRRADALQNVFVLTVGSQVDAVELRDALFPTTGNEADGRLVPVRGGSDGAEPTLNDYTTALNQLSQLEDISIVAAPGYSAMTGYQAIQGELLTHVDNRSRSRYRIAVLDTPPNQTPGQARDARSRIDSTRAALYYPWVIVADPTSNIAVNPTPRELALPPSGFVCGIYARNDIERAVYKAPANEVVRSALRFERTISFGEQEMLNPLGVNCLRYLPGRGYRVWGARTASSDPEWKYVNVRRFFNYLEASIDRGTQWAVFEPNGERLWANVRDTIAAFLYNEWVSGALLGSSEREAFFVRCDRSTMTQNDLDNGRLICLIGVAVIKPAEFVIFRIGQKTADARS